HLCLVHTRERPKGGISGANGAPEAIKAIRCISCASGRTVQDSHRDERYLSPQPVLLTGSGRRELGFVRSGRFGQKARHREPCRRAGPRISAEKRASSGWIQELWVSACNLESWLVRSLCASICSGAFASFSTAVRPPGCRVRDSSSSLAFLSSRPATV